MGAKDKRKKPPQIVDAEILGDGAILIEMNIAFPLGNSKKIILPADTLAGLIEEHASMPPASDTDFPGVPILEYWDVFEDPEDTEDPDSPQTEEQ